MAFSPLDQGPDLFLRSRMGHAEEKRLWHMCPWPQILLAGVKVGAGDGERILSSMDCVRKIGYSHIKEWIWIPILSHCSMSYACLHAKSFPSCLVLCNSMDCNPPGSSVHGILQARILERVAISFFRRSFLSRDQTRVSIIGRWILYHWVTQEALRLLLLLYLIL